MDKIYLVKVQDTNNDKTILKVLEYGFIEAILGDLGIFIVSSNENLKEKLKKCKNILQIEEDEKFDLLINA